VTILAPRQIFAPRQTFYGDQFVQGVQVRVNASTFQVYKTCPRKYQLAVLEGRGKGEDDPDLRFGTLIHAAKAVYEVNKARGASHNEALQGGFRYLLHETWDEGLGKPSFMSDGVKNRTTLLRTFVWYCDTYADDTCETLILPSGRPAVELQFEFDSGVTTWRGDKVTFCGTLDRIVRFGGKLYIMDTKTSSSARWLTAENYSPDGQFSLYCVAGRVCFGMETEGIILDGVEVGPNGSKFRREIVPRGKEILAEWLRDQRVHLGRLMESFREDSWPQNDAVCGLYGGCGFRRRCSGMETGGELA
jgi:hypothetical protein